MNILNNIKHWAYLCEDEETKLFQNESERYVLTMNKVIEALDKMIKEDGNTNIDYFLHYPCIAPGKIAISSEPESIESFSLIENFTNKANGKGQIYPITLMDSSEVPIYYSAI